MRLRGLMLNIWSVKLTVWALLKYSPSNKLDVSLCKNAKNSVCDIEHYNFLIRDLMDRTSRSIAYILSLFLTSWHYLGLNFTIATFDGIHLKGPLYEKNWSAKFKYFYQRHQNANMLKVFPFIKKFRFQIFLP